MPANLITFVHFSTASASSAPNCAGVPPDAGPRQQDGRGQADRAAADDHDRKFRHAVTRLQV
jgi:hypothetical protein